LTWTHRQYTTFTDVSFFIQDAERLVKKEEGVGRKNEKKNIKR